jgi:hypothetical protein
MLTSSYKHWRNGYDFILERHFCRGGHPAGLLAVAGMSIPLMSVKAVEQTVTVARAAFLVLTLHLGYSVFESASHWIEDGRLSDHTMEHIVQVGFTVFIMGINSRALLELFLKSQRPQ